MALAAHLRELRRRFLLIAAGLLVGAIVGWILYDPVFKALQAPVDNLRDLGLDATLNFDNVAGSFDMKIRIAMFLGVLLTSPWWIYQIWAFIMPGLTSKERRYAVGFVGAAVPLFLGGAYVAWSVLPNAVRLLTEFTPEGAANVISAAVYLKFVMHFVLAFGLAFLMPLLMVVLSFLGLVKAGTWLRGWRWAIVGIFTFCAFATPTPDAISMIMMALPIVALYFLAVGVCYLRDRSVAKRRAAEDAAEAAADAAYAAREAAAKATDAAKAAASAVEPVTSEAGGEQPAEKA